MLDTVQVLVDGTRVHVDRDVWDIERRIREGDPVLGWRGDPSFRLFVNTEEFITDANGRPIVPPTANPTFGWFEVWGVDAHGQQYLVTEAPECDVNLIRRLAEIDYQHSDVVERAMANQARKDKEKAQAAAEHRAEVMDKLHHALIRSNGAHLGGLSRRIY